jgi:hypothetical protein
MLRRVIAAAAGLLAALGHSAGAQQQAPAEIEILSKADAVRLFGLTKDQWLREVRTAAAAGAATPTPPTSPTVGMSTTTAEGDLLTVRLDYSQGDAKPSFIQVVVGYRPHRAALFPEPRLAKLIAAAERQMAPEFEVIGDAKRIEGGIGLFFMILDKRR